MGPNKWQLNPIKYFTDTIGGQVLVFLLDKEPEY